MPESSKLHNNFSLLLGMLMTVSLSLTEVEFPAVAPLLEVAHPPEDVHGLVVHHGRVVVLGRTGRTGTTLAHLEIFQIKQKRLTSELDNI